MGGAAQTRFGVDFRRCPCFAKMVSLEVDDSRFTATGNLDCRLGNLGQESV